MKKPLRFFSFVFFLFAIYLNVFYKEDSFLARVVAGKSEVAKQQTAQKQSSKQHKQNTDLYCSAVRWIEPSIDHKRYNITIHIVHQLFR